MVRAARLSDLAHLAHLARRFAGSLRPGGPAAADDAWALGWLTEGERQLWRRMSAPDRRHAAGVARAVVDGLGDAASRPVVAAALLHDVGKVDAALGTLARAFVTGAALVAGRDRVAGQASASRRARYLRHDEIGAGLLAAAGADRITIAWAREHHLPPDQWSLPAELANALKAADDD